MPVTEHGTSNTGKTSHLFAALAASSAWWQVCRPISCLALHAEIGVVVDVGSQLTSELGEAFTTCNQVEEARFMC